MKNKFKALLLCAGICAVATASSLADDATTTTAPATATAPATTQGDTITWHVAVPGGHFLVGIQYPGDWKKLAYKTGQPYLYLPGDNGKGMNARWEFDVFNGRNGAAIDEVLKEFAASMDSRDGQTKVTKKELVDRPDGSKAAVVEYTTKIGDTELTYRKYIINLETDSMLMATEVAPSSAWEKYSTILNKISDSVDVRVNKKQ